MTADVERVKRELQRLPIFPLPGIALLPGALLPLHVFEPRYRRLVRDCSRGAGVLGLACIPNGEEGISDPLRKPRVLPVLGAGVLARIERLPDGRSNIVVRGVLRAHIESEHEMVEPYRIVDATALSDEISEGDEARADSLRRVVFALCTAQKTMASAALAQIVRRAATPGELADAVAGAVIEDPFERQGILETLSVTRRLLRVERAVSASLALTAANASSLRN
ncbi:MAG: LON peptidase substrate-binding domain-containing protein [Myxococcales bacterium]